MNYGYQWFAFAVGFFYGVIVGGVIVARLVGW